MPEAVQPSTDRLLALFDHLGIGKAHVATQVPADVGGLVTGHGGRVAGVVLCTPTRLDPALFGGVADRLAMIASERGLTAEVTARAADRLPGTRRLLLRDYEAPGWADVIADRTDAIVAAMVDFLGGTAADTPRRTEGEGEHAGITYRMTGRGPALVLLPFFLAPSQWEPAIAQLSERFTVIVLGGRHLGGVAALEDRASVPTYQAMFRTLIDLMAPKPGECILDVGCGAGSLDRQLVRRLGKANPLSAVDVNRFLLREAAALAKSDGLEGTIQFSHGSAEALPFPDSSQDCVFSVTVLEECNADIAIREMIRVARPGGRVGVIVRSIDLPQWWSVTVDDTIRRKVDVPPQSVGPRGVADASLYRRMRAAGLADLICFPFMVTLDRPGGPIWRYREDHVLSLLAPDELKAWRAACQAAAADGLLMTAHAMHCAVGTKP
jgi:ubiquinone/menaquinone biosynthesis C-methylase UbiE